MKCYFKYMFISAAFFLSVKVEHPKLFCSVALFVNEVPQRWLLFKVCTINAITVLFIAPISSHSRKQVYVG